jgi:hypothetical protein
MHFKAKTGSSLQAGRRRLPGMLALAACLLCLPPALAGPPVAGAEAEATRGARDFRSLDREIQVLKREVLELNRDIRLLEEAVLYPADERLVVFVSLSDDTSSRLNRVSITRGGQWLAGHDYSAEEAAALQAGSVHRLYEGRLEPGSHYLDIVLDGVKADGEAFAAKTLAKISKRAAPRFLELQLVPGGDGQAPGLTVKAW